MFHVDRSWLCFQIQKFPEIKFTEFVVGKETMDCWSVSLSVCLSHCFIPTVTMSDN